MVAYVAVPEKEEVVAAVAAVPGAEGAAAAAPGAPARLRVPRLPAAGAAARQLPGAAARGSGQGRRSGQARPRAARSRALRLKLSSASAIPGQDTREPGTTSATSSPTSWRGSPGAGFTAQKFAAELAEAGIGGERVWIMKPQTYMNHSGEAVGAALRFWKLAAADLVVVHDDLELEPFRVQLKVGGGHGGHNGLKSVNAHVGSPEYARVRLGVGRPPPRGGSRPTTVLGRFAKRRRRRSGGLLERAAAAARAWRWTGAAKAMNEFNRRPRAGGEEPS